MTNSEPRRAGWRGVALAALVGTLLLQSAVFWRVTHPRRRVLHEFAAPGGDMHLVALEVGADYSGWPLASYPQHALFVGRDPQGDSYGHVFPFALRATPRAFGFAPSVDDVRTRELRALEVSWEQGGVRVRSASGHQLFIPKSAYEGGR